MSKTRFPMTLDLAKAICTGAKEKTLSEVDYGNQVVIGRLPAPFLKALNIPDLDVVTSVSVLAKMVRRHDPGPGVISGLGSVIGNPASVFTSATEKGSVVVVTMMMVDGEPLIASIVINTPDSYQRGHMHWLTSAYGKTNRAKIAEWEESGLLLWRP